MRFHCKQKKHKWKHIKPWKKWNTVLLERILNLWSSAPDNGNTVFTMLLYNFFPVFLLYSMPFSALIFWCNCRCFIGLIFAFNDQRKCSSQLCLYAYFAYIWGSKVHVSLTMDFSFSVWKLWSWDFHDDSPRA